MNKQEVFVSQLEKYARLRDGERLVRMSEDLLKWDYFDPSSFVNTSTTGVYRKIKCEKRRLKVMKMRWFRELEGMYDINRRHPLTKLLTLEDMYGLEELYNQYRSLFRGMLRGGPIGGISFDKELIEPMEGILFDENDRLNEAIEASGNGFIPKNAHNEMMNHVLHQLLILKEVDDKIVVKEIYLPYSGIVIQLTDC